MAEIAPKPSRGRGSTRGGRGGGATSGRGSGGRATSSFQQSSGRSVQSAEPAEDDEVVALRSKYGKEQLPLLKELFSEWSEQASKFVIVYKPS